MNHDLFSALLAPGVLAAVIGGVFAWVTGRSSRADKQGALIDDLNKIREQDQAEVKSLRGEIQCLRTEVEQTREATRLAKEEAWAIRDAARLQISMTGAYIFALRAHIIQELPPPPPEIPEELMDLLHPKK